MERPSKKSTILKICRTSLDSLIRHVFFFLFQALSTAAAELKNHFPKLIIESSGGVTEENLTEFCDKNVDVISLSRLTQGYSVVDFSLKIHREGIDPGNPTVT